MRYVVVMEFLSNEVELVHGIKYDKPYIDFKTRTKRRQQRVHLII